MKISMKRGNCPEMKSLNINIKKINPDSIIPEYMSEYSSGADIFANNEENIIIEPGDIKLIPGGFSLSIPAGFEGQVRPRSGLSLKHGITVLNSPGTIDSDYRGEVKIILINHGKKPFTVKKGERIAQLVITEVIRAHFHKVSELDNTVRSDGGFGHTGV